MSPLQGSKKRESPSFRGLTHPGYDTDSPSGLWNFSVLKDSVWIDDFRLTGDDYAFFVLICIFCRKRDNTAGYLRILSS